MRKSLIILFLAAMPLAGCMDDPAMRTLAGAGTGAVIADATGGNALTGAVIGGIAGAVSCGIEGLPPCN